MDRFWAKVTILGDDDCWPWNGYVNEGGYGRFWLDGKMQAAHRVAWMLANQNKTIPTRLIRHSCDNRPCCNPKHLLPGSHQQNTQDAIKRGRFKLVRPAQRRDFCKRGHPMAPENVRISRQGRGRECLTCRRATNKIYDAKRRCKKEN